MTAPAPKMSRLRISRPVRWLIGVALCVALLVLALGLMDWNLVRGPLSRLIASDIQRPVTIGHLQVHLFSATPSVDVQDLVIGNPAWAGGGDMVELPQGHVAVVLSRLLTGHLALQTLELDNPSVVLIEDQGGRANWNLGNGEPKQASHKPAALPPLRHFALRGGSLKIDDALARLTFQGSVGATEHAASDAGGGAGRNAGGDTAREAEPFRLQGQGTLNKEPFKLTFEGSALLEVQRDRPYRFQTDVEAGPSSVKVRGSIAKPFDLGAVDADIELQGENLANLYYLTNLALPLTRPYRVSLHAHRDGNHFAFDNVQGKLGSSDIHGRGSVDLAQKDGRPTLAISLTSHSLNLADLGVAVGANVPEPGDRNGKYPSQIPAPAPEPISPLLLPTFPFQFDRLRAMDATMDFNAESVQTQKVPIRNVAFRLKLDHGDLDIDPLEFQLPQGKLDGTIELNASGDVPHTSLDLRLSDIRLDQFKPKNASDAPVQGVMEGRLHIEGSGNSVHAIAADADGTLSAVITHGEIRAAFAELAGIDVVHGLGLLLTSKDKTVPIRCSVAEFQLHDGDAQTQHLLADTTDVIVTGDGSINLGDEKLDLNLRGQPKKLRFDRLRAPINVRGTLRHPSVSLSAPALAKQGAAAAVLAAVATPFAAVLAFVDPGLAKNADCADLTREAEGKVAQPPPVAQLQR
jgi:uncharacterized protein involved in outer membrane biogenesis